MRDSPGGKPSDVPCNHSEARTFTLITAIEQQLHSEADSETRKPLLERLPHRFATWRKSIRRGAECTDPWENQHVGGHGKPSVRLEMHIDSRASDRLGK
jgi:hypothetical protein